MTSKNLFFNLMKEDSKRRLWTFALTSLVFFFMFPVWAALLVSRYLSPVTLNMDWADPELGLVEMKVKLMERFIEWISIESGLLVFAMIVFAVVCAVSGFSYLHSKKKTDFFHSIPVKREKQFAITYINGILYTAVPYLIGLILASLLIQIKASAPIAWGTVFTSYVIHMSFYLLIYSVTTAAVVLTGNTLVSLMGTAVFFIWGPGITLLTYGYFGIYFKTFYQNGAFLESFSKYSSPISWYISVVGEDSSTALAAVGVLAVAAVITVLAVCLYKKRPSEAAGRAMAFKKSQPIIKFLLVVPMALFSSLFFYTMRGGDGWSIFGLLWGIGISYCIVEIIYNFDFRRLFAHKKQLAVCTIASAAILAFFRFDVIGYDSYIPSADKVEASGVYIRYLDSETVDDYRRKAKIVSIGSGRHNVEFYYNREEERLLSEMRLLNTEDVLTLAERGIQDVKADREMQSVFNGNTIEYQEREPNRREYVVIEYHMKNGRNVTRGYSMDLNAVEPAIDNIYGQKAYKEAVYPILKWSKEDISGINYQEERSYRHVEVPEPSMKEKLFTAYQEELLMLSTDTRRKESPVAAIQFKTNEMQEMIDLLRKEGNRYTDFNNFYYYPVYPSFTKTMALLKECGIDAGTFLNADNVEKIELIGHYTKEELLSSAESEGEFAVDMMQMAGYEDTLIIKDKKEIEEILDASVSVELSYRNNLYDIDSDISVTVFVPVDRLDETSTEFPEEYRGKPDDRNAEYSTYSLSLGKDRIPEFVRKGLPNSFD